MQVAWVLLVAAGCSVDGDTSDTGDQAVVAPTPYVVDDGEEIQPGLDQAAIEAGLADAITQVLRFDARPISRAYQRAMTNADGDCPIFYTDGNGNRYWSSYCYADSGAEFNGYGYHFDYAGLVDDYGNVFDSYEIVSASSQIFLPDGTTFEGSGYVTWSRLHANWGTNGDGVVQYADVAQTYLSGSWVAVEPDGSTTWLSEGVKPETYMYLWESPDTNYHGAYVNGGVSNLGGSVDTVSFDDLSLNGYWTCSLEPSGSISIRDDAGYWYDVFFDVDNETGTAPEGQCDGCGEVWYRGVRVTQACADFSPWFAWKRVGSW